MVKLDLALKRPNSSQDALNEGNLSARRYWNQLLLPCGMSLLPASFVLLGGTISSWCVVASVLYQFPPRMAWLLRALVFNAHVFWSNMAHMQHVEAACWYALCWVTCLPQGCSTRYFLGLAKQRWDLKTS